MPGVTLALGTAVGAHSFVRESSNPLDIIAGVPGKCVGKRKDDFLLLEKKISPA
jgi:acetyltransferase-like isoleucine patch superfamily enzyme